MEPPQTPVESKESQSAATIAPANSVIRLVQKAPQSPVSGQAVKASPASQIQPEVQREPQAGPPLALKVIVQASLAPRIHPATQPAQKVL